MLLNCNMSGDMELKLNNATLIFEKAKFYDCTIVNKMVNHVMNYFLDKPQTPNHRNGLIEF